MEVAYPFDAKTGIMSGGVKRAREMEILQQRFQAELVAVRGLLRKAAAVRLPSAPRVKESRPGLSAEEPPAKKMKASPPVLAPVPVPVKAPRKRKPTAEKRKASPPPVPVIKSKKPKMTGSEREMLAEDLEAFVAEIPDHIVELLKKQSCATRPGEIEIDLHGLDDAAVVELQEQVDKFAREKRAPPQERHQDGPKVMAQEEEEDEEEYVDICGGVSPLAIVPAPLLQLVQDEATSGSPSSSSSNDSDSDVDICGGVSPLAFVPAPLLPLPLVQEETNSGSPCSSSSGDSDTDDSSSSGDSDTDDSSSSDSDDSDDSEHSGSSSDPDSESDEIVDSPAPAIVSPPTFQQVDRALERQRTEATSLAREKARQEVLHTERNAMPDHTLHREDVKSLGIDEYNTAKPNNLLWQIGLYLKVDDDEDEHDDWNQHRQSFHEDLEEGEIR
uniref:NET domain-containing protein n=1 Tax=Hordeum vulgare subsp. vulgare TaxID=112509 RepID=A0A8I7BEE5_HORVV